MSVRRASALTALAWVLGAGGLRAQALAGTVRDSASGAPVAGAFVEVVDSGRSRVAAALSDSAGRFGFDVELGRSTLRAEAIGYASAATSFELEPGEERTLDLRLPPRRVALPPPGASGPPECHLAEASAGDAVAGVWRGVRQSLRLADWSMNEAGLVLVTRRYVRTSRWARLNGDTVEVDTTSAQPSQALTLHVPSPGARAERQDTAALAQPALDFLSSPSFQSAHCFALHTSGDGVALEFTPAPGRKGALRGTFWLDRAARALQRVDFTYTYTRSAGPLRVWRPRGTLELSRTPEGYLLVRRWVLPLMVNGVLRESGGELLQHWREERWSPAQWLENSPGCTAHVSAGLNSPLPRPCAVVDSPLIPR